MEATQYKELLDNIHTLVEDADAVIILIRSKDKSFSALVDGKVKHLSQLLANVSHEQPDFQQAIKMYNEFVEWKRRNE